MTEDQYRRILHTSKAQVVAECRAACEDAIEKSGLLATQDVTVLQAFVLYIVSTRLPQESLIVLARNRLIVYRLVRS